MSNVSNVPSFHETPEQNCTVNRLYREGWRIDSHDDDTIYLSRRDRRIRSMTHYCQVGPDGRVNA